MEARLGSEARSVYMMGSANVWATGKRSVEWDLNDWRWDGDMFLATPIKPVPTRGLMNGFPLEGASSNSGSSSEDANAEIERGKGDLEKRRRVLAEDHDDEGGSLSLKLGGQGFSSEDRNGRLKSKASSGGSKAVCQVEGCGVDLGNAKDYHRRHKVCEAHSKATKALVANVFQRFCQQCSRFHVLQEFDEGKRSCRRRLAGHNKRRRKIQPEAATNSASQSNEPANNLLLLNLLKLLSTTHSSKPNQPSDQELLCDLIKSVTNQTSESAATTTPRVLESPPDSTKQTSQSIRNDQRGSQVKMNDFDLNDIYIDSDDTDDADGDRNNFAQTSGNSDSASAQSPSSSSGDGGRTDRIIFKLFGKEPNDIPLVVRTQILDWLSHSPTDIESYIRPGCVVFTVYLRQSESAWEDLRSDLSASLKNLLESSDDPFWRLGWIFVRVQDQAALACNGEVIFDTCLGNYGRIVSVKPIATPSAKNVRFSIKFDGLSLSSAGLVCALEDSHVIEDEKDEVDDGIMSSSCSMPSVTSRGFLEVEDERLGCAFFPFIVAEEEICKEIRGLEAAIDLGESDVRDRAINFVNELGWLLRRSQLRKRMKNTAPFCQRRFKWLVEYSLEREWCAVLKKLLDILLDGADRTGEFDVVLALSELCLLHKAVRRNSRKLVEFLLSYVPSTRNQVPNLRPIFRPDATDASGLTPLHIAAGKDESESVLDALTNDSQMIGVDAWEHARDSAGLTPAYYARLRGNISYIHLVKRKGVMKEEKDYVALDVGGEKVGDMSVRERPVARLEMGRQCRACSEKLSFRTGHGSLVYRPAMVCMIAIATVCVCAALYFKSCPEVEFIFRPFRWEMLEYGAM